MEFLATADPSQMVSKGSTTGRLSVDAVVVEYAGAFETHRSVSDLVIGVHLDPVYLEVDMAGRRRAPCMYAPGQFDVSPPNSDYRALRTRPSKSLGIAIRKDIVAHVLSDVAPDRTDNFGALHQFPQSSDLIFALCRQIVAEIEAGRPLGPLYADSLVQALVMELYGMSQGGPVYEDLEKERIDQTTLARINEYTDANEAEKIDLLILADIAAMPVTKFTRLFKHTTGQTPYQYMLQSRLRKAQRLVGTTSFPIAQIATDCGFASQSHMTDLFRTKLGCTPGQLRKQQRS